MVLKLLLYGVTATVEIPTIGTLLNLPDIEIEFPIDTPDTEFNVIIVDPALTEVESEVDRTSISDKDVNALLNPTIGTLLKIPVIDIEFPIDILETCAGIGIIVDPVETFC